MKYDRIANTKDSGLVEAAQIMANNRLLSAVSVVEKQSREVFERSIKCRTFQYVIYLYIHKQYQGL
jgi:hypothetical protein